jgi:hypothetical protein
VKADSSASVSVCSRRSSVCFADSASRRDTMRRCVQIVIWFEEYPSLKREDVQSCLDYASKLMANHYSLVPMA